MGVRESLLAVFRFTPGLLLASVLAVTYAAAAGAAAEDHLSTRWALGIAIGIIGGLLSFLQLVVIAYCRMIWNQGRSNERKLAAQAVELASERQRLNGVIAVCRERHAHLREGEDVPIPHRRASDNGEGEET